MAVLTGGPWRLLRPRMGIPVDGTSRRILLVELQLQHMLNMHAHTHTHAHTARYHMISWIHFVWWSSAQMCSDLTHLDTVKLINQLDGHWGRRIHVKPCSGQPQSTQKSRILGTPQNFARINWVTLAAVTLKDFLKHQHTVTSIFRGRIRPFRTQIVSPKLIEFESWIWGPRQNSDRWWIFGNSHSASWGLHSERPCRGNTWHWKTKDRSEKFWLWVSQWWSTIIDMLKWLWRKLVWV